MKINNITKKYKQVNKKEDKIVLNNISLEFNNNGIVYIVGESGSGKSTLLNILSINDKDFEGDYILNGLKVNKFDERMNDFIKRNYITYIRQENNFIETLTIYENINIVLPYLNRDDNKLLELLDTFKLPIEYLDKYEKELSGGEKQKFSLIKSILLDTKIIIADEPTSFLDEDTKKIIMDVFSDLAKEKLIIISTHDVDIQTNYKGTVYMIDSGSIKANEVSKYNDVEEKIVLTKKYKEKYFFKNYVKMFLSFPIRKLMIVLICSLLISYLAHALVLINTNSFKSIVKIVNTDQLDELYFDVKGSSMLEETDRLYLSNKYSDSTFFSLYNESGHFEKYLNDYENKTAPKYYKYSVFNSYAIYSDELRDETNMYLIAGSYPKSREDNIYEALISEFHFEYFRKYGYKNDSLIEVIETPKQLIDKEIRISNRIIKIKGVYSNKGKLTIFNNLKINDYNFDYFEQGFTHDFSTALIVAKEYVKSNSTIKMIFTPINKKNEKVDSLLKDAIFNNQTKYKVVNRELAYYNVNQSKKTQDIINFSIITLIIVLISGLMILTYFLLVFNMNKNSFANLRTWGIEKKYIVKLYTFDSITTAIVIFVIASIVTRYFNNFYNNEIFRNTAITIELHSYNFITFITLLLIACLSSFLPKMFIYKFKLNENISNLFLKE